MICCSFIEIGQNFQNTWLYRKFETSVFATNLQDLPMRENKIVKLSGGDRDDQQ